MISLLIAYRSFIRQRRRSILSAAAISLSLALMLVFVGFADDGHTRMAEIGIRLGAGHVLVQGSGYQERQTLDLVVPDPAEVVATARLLPHVTDAVVRVNSGGLLQAGELSSAVLVSGVDPHLEPQVSTVASADHRVSGDYLRARQDMPFTQGPADIYLGADLADRLEVGLGDRVVLTVSPRGTAEPSSAAFRVRGTFRTGLRELDGGAAQIPLGEAQRLFDLGQSATQVAVMVDELDRSDATAAALAASLGPHSGLEVLGWKVALRELYEAIVLDDLSMYLMMAIVFVVVAIGIFNTVLMSVAERTRELGVMMAIGTSKGQLFGIVLAEAAVLAVVAAAIGVGLGLMGHGYIATHGIDVGALAGGNYELAGITIGGKLYSRLSVGVVVRWTLVVIGLVIASATYPAWRASRLEPVEAMRHV
ncbi:MAG: ABC transporter permease [Myxococcales bacterium]|nr:ABC transporter permease [Myxococcales bacterium]